MDLLEFFYGRKIKIANIIQREIRPNLSSPLLNLYGPRGCGKSALIKSYLSRYKPEEYLYIDLEDPAFILHHVEPEQISTFVKQNGIKLIVFDHFVEGMFDPLLKSDATIAIISRKALSHDAFFKQELAPFTFKELLPTVRGSSAQALFGRYLKHGSLPIAYGTKGNEPTANFKSLFHMRFSLQEQSLLVLLAKYNARPMSAYRLYTLAKEHFRISKDLVYESLERFEEEKILFSILEKGSKRNRRFVLYDFAFARYLYPLMPFNQLFEAMVLLHILSESKNVVYVDHGTYYMEKESTLLIIAPFESEEVLKSKIKHAIFKHHQLSLRSVTALTVSSTFSEKESSIDAKAIPFYRWAPSKTN